MTVRVSVPHSKRHRHGRNPMRTGGRLRRHRGWLSARATALSGTGTGQNFTADTANDEIDITTHGHVAGDGPFVVSSTGTLPTGLVAGTLYWVSAPTANALGVHLNRKDALNAVNAVDLTAAGSGTHTLTPAESGSAVHEHVRQGVTPTRMQGVTDVDSLI